MKVALDKQVVNVVALSPMDTVPVRGDFEDLYRREFPGLLAVARALTGDTRDSEDLVQDTMVKAYLRWPRVGRLERPGGWCHFVLVNACRSWWRRRRTEALHVVRHRASDHVTAGPSPDGIAFWSAVRALPPRPRAVVALYFAADLTTAEVAEVLRLPEGTVRSDITRARGFVMRAMGEE